MAENHTLRIQYTILGTMILRPECVGEAAERLQITDFDTEGTRALFAAVVRLHMDGAPIDPITVEQAAGEDLEPLIRAVLPYCTGDFGYYCGMLRSQQQLRRLQGGAYDLVSAQTLEEAEAAMDRLNALLVARRDPQVLSARDAASAFLSRVGREERPVYITTGIEDLDKFLFLDPGDFLVLGGYPSAGKTLLSLQMALHMAAERRVGYFSLETNPQKLMDRLMAHMAQIPLWKIKKRELEEGDWKRLAAATQALAELPLDFVAAGGFSVRDIRAMSLSRRYQVVYVDYLQLVSAAGKNRYEEVTSISKDLHTMSQATGTVVVALAQLSRPEKTGGQLIPPSMSSFRESGQIEQDADVALLLWAEDPRDNRSGRSLKIGKNKEGERETIHLSFDGATQTMRPLGPDVHSQMVAAGKQAKQRNRAGQSGQVTFTELAEPAGAPLPF